MKQLSNKTMSAAKQRAFTLIEILLVLGILSILATVVVVAVNPPVRFADAHNKERRAHLNTILSAIGERVADYRGDFNCSLGPLPTSTATMATGGYDIAPCLVPDYLPQLPFDPSAEGAFFADTSNYNSKYEIVRNATSGRVTLSAPYAELGETIQITR